MASRSATVLVISIIAIIAFCLASVFGAMTGPISIFPNETDTNGTFLDNLTSLHSSDDDGSYSQDYSGYSGSSDSSYSDVETTTDDSSSSDQQPSDQSDDKGSSDSDPIVVTTTR